MQNTILLLSSSNVHGYGYLEYNKTTIREFLSGITTPLLFVPFAADKTDWDTYTAKVAKVLRTIGITTVGAHTVPRESICSNYEAIFIGGGNTFRLMRELQEMNIMADLRSAVLAGRMRYMGSSAGSNMAGKTICTTNDMPIVYPKGGFEALDLFPFQLNPHYLDPETGSKHKGETRDQRIAEYHQASDTPVIGLREGAYLSINIAAPGTLYVGGGNGAKIFLKGKEPYEAPVDSEFTL